MNPILSCTLITITLVTALVVFLVARKSIREIDDHALTVQQRYDSVGADIARGSHLRDEDHRVYVNKIDQRPLSDGDIEAGFKPLASAASSVAWHYGRADGQRHCGAIATCGACK